MTLQLKTPVLGALALLLLTGCSDSERAPRADLPDTGDVPTSDLFDPPRVIPLDFKIKAAELKAMLAGSHKYGRCTMRADNLSLTDVGIRYKGNPAKEAASGKPDFNLDFNEFVSGQKFHGLGRLILFAARDDPSYLSAPIGWELFRQAGVPAARCGFASVRLNGRDLGLYLLVEGVDRAFLGRHFAKSKGNLYDEAEDTDVDGKLEKYGDSNSVDQPDVDALAAAAKEPDPGQRWIQLQQRLDMDRFLTFTALEVLLWQKDSYAITGKKFRIYHDPTTDRMVFFPKNTEELFGQTTGPLIPEWRGLVAKAVMTTPEGQEQYRKTVAKLLETVFKPDKVQARARELAAIIRPAAVGTDAAASQKFDAAVDHFCDALARRTAFVAKQLDAPVTARASSSDRSGP